MEKPQQRTRRTSDQMFPLVAMYESSDQPQKIFCERHGLSVGAFQYWLRKYREQRSDPNHPSFHQIAVLPQGTDCIHQDAHIEIRTPSGVEIKIPLI